MQSNARGTYGSGCNRTLLHAIVYHCIYYCTSLQILLTLYTRMTTIVVMNIGTLIPNDDYSRHGHYRAVSALYPAAT